MTLLNSTMTIAAALTLAASAANAQTLMGYEGAAMFVDDFNGGPDPGLCGYAAGPIVATFPVTPAACPTPFPLPPAMPGLPGDIAYDSATDLVYVSDGGLIASYTTAGVFVDSFFSPMPVFGMGFDSAAGILWCTDGGGLAYGLGIPFGACGGPTGFAVLPFPIPGPGPFMDIDWDPLSGSLFACDLAGFITNFMPGGFPGPFGVYPTAGMGFPMGTPLTGLAVDDGSPFGPGHLYVSDGFVTEAILPGGAPAPPTFSFPFPAFPNPAPYHGLAYAPHAVKYGTGFDPDGLAAPINTPFGPATSPSALFSHTLTSAAPGAIAALVVGTMPACPAFAILGVPSYLLPFGPTPTIATVPVGFGGVVTLPTPLPPGLPVGFALFDQWFIIKPFGPSPLQASNGAHFRISLP